MYLMKSNAILRMREMRLIELSKCKISDQNYIAIFFAPPPPPPPRITHRRKIRWHGLLFQFSNVTFLCNSFRSEEKYLVKIIHVFDALDNPWNSAKFHPQNASNRISGTLDFKFWNLTPLPFASPPPPPPPPPPQPNKKYIELLLRHWQTSQ
jgi:hypothetical protein